MNAPPGQSSPPPLSASTLFGVGRHRGSAWVGNLVRLGGVVHCISPRRIKRAPSAQAQGGEPEVTSQVRA